MSKIVTFQVDLDDASRLLDKQRGATDQSAHKYEDLGMFMFGLGYIVTDGVVLQVSRKEWSNDDIKELALLVRYLRARRHISAMNNVLRVASYHFGRSDGRERFLRHLRH